MVKVLQGKMLHHKPCSTDRICSPLIQSGECLFQTGWLQSFNTDWRVLVSNRMVTTSYLTSLTKLHFGKVPHRRSRKINIFHPVFRTFAQNTNMLSRNATPRLLHEGNNNDTSLAYRSSITTKPPSLCRLISWGLGGREREREGESERE